MLAVADTSIMRALAHILLLAFLSMNDVPAHQRPRVRKTASQARSVETVRVIVEAAARILEKHGHAGFSTNAVAACAGVSIGSLYQYFPGKEALIGALIARETAYLLEDVEAAKTLTTGSAALSAYIHASVAHQFRRPVLARLLDFEEARLPFDPETQRVSAQIRIVILNILARPDLPRQPDHDLATQDVMAMTKGMVDAAGAIGDADRMTLVRRVERAVFGYLNASAWTNGFALISPDDFEEFR